MAATSACPPTAWPGFMRPCERLTLRRTGLSGSCWMRTAGIRVRPCGGYGRSSRGREQESLIMIHRLRVTLVAVAVFAGVPARADVGDPQVRPDHPWYPGELACSTFERLVVTQAEHYRRAAGAEPATDEQKALA